MRRSEGALAQFRLGRALAASFARGKGERRTQTDTSPAPGLPSGASAGAAVGAATGAAAEGTSGGRKLVRSLLVAIRFIFLSVLAIHAWYIVTSSLLILSYRVWNPPASVIMVYRAILYGWKLEAPRPVELKKIPLFIRSMLISVEDGKFYTHHGLDFEAFERAKRINAAVGKPLYGGSTLTMQVARTLFLVPEKSYIRKYFEIIAALELEILLDKDRILELYFGYAEWGKGLFGMEAASARYFKKSVSSLTRDDAARLIALLSSPIKYNPSTLSRSGILRERYSYLTRKYVSGGAQLPDTSGQIEPPPQGIEPSPFDETDPRTGLPSVSPEGSEDPESPGDMSGGGGEGDGGEGDGGSESGIENLDGVKGSGEMGSEGGISGGIDAETRGQVSVDSAGPAPSSP